MGETSLRALNHGPPAPLAFRNPSTHPVSCHIRGAFAQNTPIGGPAGARRRWKLANRRPLLHGELSCPCSSDRRFPRLLRRRAVAGPPTLRLSRRRQHGEQDQGARARPALEACTTRPGHAVNMLTEERVVRELLGGAPPCRRLSREAHSSGTSYSSTAKRTRKSKTATTRAAQLAMS